MFSVYMCSVIIYMLIISSAAMICELNVRKNGWLNEPGENKNSKIAMLTAMAAVPIFRLLVVIFIFVMAVYPKEEVIAWVEKHKDHKS